MSSPELGPVSQPELSLEQQKLFSWLLKRESGGIEIGERRDFVVHRKYADEDVPPAWVKFNAEALYRDVTAERAAVLEYIKLLHDESGELIDFDMIAGVPRGATGLAFEIANQLGFRLQKQVGMVHVDKEGGVFSVEPLPPEQRGKKRAIVVEDVATTGTSSGKVVKALQEAGYVVVLVVALVDREQGAEEWLESMGVPMRSVAKLNTVLDFGLDQRLIGLDEWGKSVKAEKAMKDFLASKPRET